MSNKKIRVSVKPKTPEQTLSAMAQTAYNAAVGRISLDKAAFELGNLTLSAFDSVFTKNRRVKASAALPRGVSNDREFDEILKGGVLNNESRARAISYDLGASEYTYRNIVKTYQDILTYRNYFYPTYNDYDKTALFREMSLLDKLQKKFRAEQTLHEITGRALFEGKVFAYHDYKVDKSHNKALENRLIPLPSDFCVIVDSNNPISKYTVAFNMMYFSEYPEAILNFGDLFLPWADAFASCLERGSGGDIFGSTRTRINMNAFNQIYGDLHTHNSISVPLPKRNALSPEYWVILPTHRVWTFEIDDTVPWAAPIFTGLFKAILKLAPAEEIFLELIQNPLVSVMTGEIPYLQTDARGNKTQNNFAMSIDEEKEKAYLPFFMSLWHKLLSELGTQGVGAYFAPFTNYKFHQLGEAPNADKIPSAALHGAITKSGLAGIIPSTDSVLAGQISVAKKMAAAFPTTVYRTAERMMNTMYESLNLRYGWTHRFFGNVFDDPEEIKALEKSLTLGIQPDLYRYNALKDRSILDDLQMSRVIDDLELMKYRVPLQSSYHSTKAGIPNWDIGDRDEPGRPHVDTDNLESDDTEATLDKAQ